jgi:uncharacterized glyoxalase superfamily protein PhnB
MESDAEQQQYKKQVGTIPEGYTTVTPFVAVKGAAGFIDFLKAAFDGKELGRVPNPDGTLGHAEVKIGNAIVMMFDSKPDWPLTPALLRLYVPDCDATYNQALKAGATSVTRPTLQPWGDRVARVRDPFGNLWWIMAHLEDVSPEEEQRRWGQKEYIDAMNYVQSAEFFPKETKSNKE